MNCIMCPLHQLHHTLTGSFYFFLLFLFQDHCCLPKQGLSHRLPSLGRIICLITVIFVHHSTRKERKDSLLSCHYLMQRKSDHCATMFIQLPEWRKTCCYVLLLILLPARILAGPHSLRKYSSSIRRTDSRGCQRMKKWMGRKKGCNMDYHHVALEIPEQSRPQGKLISGQHNL